MYIAPITAGGARCRARAAPLDTSGAAWRFRHLVAGAALVALASAGAPARAQEVALGTAANFGVLAGAAVASTGATVVNGYLGISPGNASSVTGFVFSPSPGPGTVTGATHFADGVALQAQNDVTAALDSLASRPCDATISADLGGMTLAPGVYCSGSSMGLTGTLTLDAQGDPNAQFIFKLGSTLTTASNAAVNVINSGQNCNVFWQVGSSATLGTGTSFVGTVIAQASVTLTTGASTNGRMFARTGAVTLDGSNVSVCSAVDPVPPALAPTLGKAFNPDSIVSGGTSTLYFALNNPDASPATLTAPLTDILPAGLVVAATPNASTTCGGTGQPIAVPGAALVSLPAGRVIPANGTCLLAVDVTAAGAGSYLNTLAAGALMTDHGNNADPASATLSVAAGAPVDRPPPNAIPTLSTLALLAMSGALALCGGLLQRRRAAAAIDPLCGLAHRAASGRH